MGNDLDGVHLGVVHTGGAEGDGDKTARGGDVVEDLVDGLVLPAGGGEDVEIGKDSTSIDGDIEDPLARGRPMGLSELQGHLIRTRRHIEAIGERIPIPFGLIKGLVTASGQGPANRVGRVG